MSNKSMIKIGTLRIGLYALFLLYPILLIQGRFLEASVNLYVGFGTFFFSIALVTGLLAVITSSYILAYAAFLTVLASEFLLDMPPVVFSTHLAVALIFAEGISALRPYQSVAQQIKRGVHENVSSNLQSSLRRFRSTFLRVVAGLFAMSIGYGILPEILPITSDLPALAVYATIGLIAIAITALYLGERA